MAQRSVYRRLVGGFGASLVVHAAVIGGAFWLLDEPDDAVVAEPLPFDLVVPDVPPPALVPDNLPTENTANAVKLPAAAATKPARARPAPDQLGQEARLDKAAENPKRTTVEAPVAQSTSLAAVTLPPDAGVPETPSTDPAEAPPAEPGTPDRQAAAEGQQPASASDQQHADPPLDGVEATAGLDPVLVDLRAFVPKGSRLMLVIRVDRVRNTPWAGAMDAILSPMPDYKAIIASNSELKLADAFESIVIATPDPEIVTATFLAARTTRDAATMRENLAAANTVKPRVEWAQVQGVSVGTRTERYLAEMKDHRVFVIPSGGWVALTRPEHVPHLTGKKGGKAPDWIARLAAIEAQTGDGDNAPFAVLSAADLDADYLEVPGGGQQLPVPERLTITMSPHPDGVVFGGAAVFADAATAKTFFERAEDGRKGALRDFATKFILDRLHCRGAIERLQFRHSNEFVTFSTTLGSKDAAGLFKAAALWSKEYFRTARVKKADKPANEEP